MVLRSHENSMGAWFFLAGVVLAVFIGLSASLISIPLVKAYSAQIYAILVILGLVVGFTINVSGKDSQTFLVTGAILVVVSRFGMESVTGSLIGVGVGDTVASAFAALLVLFVPATIIVALKTVFSMTRV